MGAVCDGARAAGFGAARRANQVTLQLYAGGAKRAKVGEPHSASVLLDAPMLHQPRYGLHAE